MVEYNVAKTTDGPNRVRAGATINSTVLITNDSPHFENEYNRQNSMAPWVQRVPSVQVGANQANVVGIRFFNAGAVASLAGVMDEADSILRLRNFEFSTLANAPAAIAFVARVYQGTNNFGALLATIPGSDLTGEGTGVPVPGTQFYVEVEALQPDVFMNRAQVGELTVDILAAISETVPVAPAGITRTWEAMHSEGDAFIPATSGVGDISWTNIPLPAGAAIAISIHDLVPVAGDYVNAASITGDPGDTGVWTATGQEIEVLPPLQDLVDCGGAWDIQARQAFLRGVLKGVVAPAYAVFKLYNAEGTNLIWQSDPIPGDGTPAQAIETVVPFGDQVMMPGQQYEFEIEVFDHNLELVSSSERCFERCAPFTTLTDAESSYLGCGERWWQYPSRHAIYPRNLLPLVKNDSDANPTNRIGPADGFPGSGPFMVTFEYWNGSTWVPAIVKDQGNTYGLPGAEPNPEQISLDSLPDAFAYVGLRGDGQAYPWRMTLRNGQNTVLEQVQCAALPTAVVPPLQCPTSVSAITNNGATLTFGPIDRNLYAFAEADEIEIQARPTGSNAAWQTVGNALFPNGDATARLTDTVNIPISGLIPGTSYDTRVIYRSDPGFTSVGYTSAPCQATLTTTGTAPIAPDAECTTADAITLTGATIHGTASADAGHSAYLQWGLSPNGPWLGQSPLVPIAGADVPLQHAITGLDPAQRYYWQTVLVVTATNAVVATSAPACSFQTRTPNAFITPTTTGDCPPNGTEDGEPPLTIEVSHTFTHAGGVDPITGPVTIEATPAPAGTTLVSWTATTTGTVTGSAGAGVGDVDETITINPASSITYTAIYNVPGPAGGAFRSLARFNGPGISQNWSTALTCTIDEQRDCEPAFLDLRNINRGDMRQFTYDGVNYPLLLDDGWTVQDLANALNAQTPGKFGAVGNEYLTTPGTRWAQGNAQLNYISETELIDFGTGGSDGNRLTSPDTTYTFEPDGGILDGFYAITSFQDTGLASFNTNAGSITADARGNPNGNAMIFNADLDPGEFARISIPTVAGGTYATSFFVINTNDPGFNQIKPNVTVRIEDSANNVIETIATGDINVLGQWTQFFVDVVAPDTELTFVFVNNSPGGNGNDLALDNIEAGLITDASLPFQNGDCGDEPEEPHGVDLTCQVSCTTNIATPFPWILPPCVEECSTTTVVSEEE